MTTEKRAFATRLAGAHCGEEDRAWTIHHRPGQLTAGGYRRLDQVAPAEAAGIARVRTTLHPGVFEYLGWTPATGWSARR